MVCCYSFHAPAGITQLMNISLEALSFVKMGYTCKSFCANPVKERLIMRLTFALGCGKSIPINIAGNHHSCILH